MTARSQIRGNIGKPNVNVAQRGQGTPSRQHVAQGIDEQDFHDLRFTIYHLRARRNSEVPAAS
jgi:hypothetical protein